VSIPVALAVDGGNSKTDLALVGADGALLGFARGPLSSPHHIGLDGCLEVLEGLLAEASASAGVGGELAIAQLMLAGADLPAEEAELQAAVSARGWAARTEVGNDTFAILRAGGERGWGVAVVCGAGINCVGVAPDGRRARFPALGPITGDWGGGLDVGMAALAAAARGEDGRGPRTTLEQVVPAYFGLRTPAELGEAIHTGSIPVRRMLELAPLVLAEAARDDVAAGIVDRLAEEVVAFARAALTRLDLLGAPVEVLVGGGLVRSADGRLAAEIDAGVRALGPQVTARLVREPPIVGAALLALDALAAEPAAHARARRELGAAVEGGGEVALVGGASDG
jgi:N-acetylglucosamine kinase-like BadF-type ATPase